ncbi:MAG TPA: IPT/TIG domain-containing protein [Candidatus Paceibacterota bacterium]|jgi:peptidoglycan hydrolase-like protein with peptidoglycan-binding domain|nr:IPT/TIG domain-containing protein [Candidatus Paceibacterota bacterium]
MKKYTLFLASFVFIILSLFSFNINSASAANCAPGDLFDTSTGQSCSNIDATAGCQSGYLFSPLTGKPCFVSPRPLCPIVLAEDFRIGAKGESVRAFQQMLIDAGFFPGKIDGIYGPITSAAGINYYKKCPKPFPSPDAPIISGVSGPQSLNVNQQGTWTITASSATGGNLSYSVVWGDMVYIPESGIKFDVTQQSATFTHSYSLPGTYTPQFTVTSANTINCITAPCPSNAGSAQASLSVNVGGISASSPVITSISPVSGRVGTKITITGKDFASTGNSVKFGKGYINGLDSNTDGTSITFTLPSGMGVCRGDAEICIALAMQVSPGTYEVSVWNTHNTSNLAYFTVTE